jgi:hypothetical protein
MIVVAKEQQNATTTNGFLVLRISSCPVTGGTVRLAGSLPTPGGMMGFGRTHAIWSWVMMGDRFWLRKLRYDFNSQLFSWLIFRLLAIAGPTIAALIKY